MLKRIQFTTFFLAIFLLGHIPLSAQLRHITENAGITFQWNRFSYEQNHTSYYALAIPLRAIYAPNRYQSVAVFLNQGYQNFDETGLYGVSDVQIRYQYLLSRNMGFLKAEEWTFLAEIYVPTGTKKLEPLKMTVTSTARIPYVRAPLLYGIAGFSAKFGALFSRPVSENLNIGFGGWYFYRGSYRPLKDGGKFNPADEILLTAAVEVGDRSTGFVGDVRYGFYTSEKVDGEKIASPGALLAASGQFFRWGWELTAIYFNRGATRFEFGGDFKSPSLFISRVGYRITGSEHLIPYLGYEHTGNGDRLYAANVFLVGFYSRQVRLGGFPLDPFVELRLGSIKGGTKTTGVRVGTSIAFQIYR